MGDYFWRLFRTHFNLFPDRPHGGLSGEIRQRCDINSGHARTDRQTYNRADFYVYLEYNIPSPISTHRAIIERRLFLPSDIDRSSQHYTNEREREREREQT